VWKPVSRIRPIGNISFVSEGLNSVETPILILIKFLIQPVSEGLNSVETRFFSGETAIL